MVMDPRLRGIFESMNGFKLNGGGGGGGASLSDHQNLINLFALNKTSPDQPNFRSFAQPSPDPHNMSGNVSSSNSCSPVDDASEDCDFSDVVLKYISEMLMEEDIDGKNCMFQDSSALQAAEKPFYEIIGEKYPPSPTIPPTYLGQALDNPVDYFTGNYSDYNYNTSNAGYNYGTSNGSAYAVDGNGSTYSVDGNTPAYVVDGNGSYNHSSSNVSGYTVDGNGASYNHSGSNGAGYSVDTNWIGDLGEYKQSQFNNTYPDYTHQITPQSSLSSTHSSSSAPDALVDSPVSKVQVPDIFCENMPMWHFQKGVEEANKFLPNGNDLIVSTERNGSFFQRPKKEGSELVIKVENKDEREHSPNGSRGKKNLHREEVDLEEGRSNKQSAVFSEQLVVRSPMFDSVLLCSGEKGESAVSDLREALQNETNKIVQQQNASTKGSGGGKSRGKKNSAKKDMVDLRTLLIHCAQAVAADDRRSANELLKQIRQHSSAYGDGSQRLAHCFADGLEARLAGTGSQIHATLITKRTSTADILKAYQLYLAACPFKKVSNFFSNHSIMTLAENASSIHIVDFGILYGFQWPCLLQRLSARPGGPPKLRITGVDFPQPGFRPAERVEETGRRLTDYAKSFNVPFEYTAIAQKWETIQLEDLKINRDEVLVVNCLYRFRNLLDETVVLDSPRNAVLQLVKKMNPDIFIHGIVNGSFSAPFFVTRFREALFHYSALFDMLETNVPRDHPERLLLERDLFGREALNVIACEGSERVERPETYKQWQVRNMRAGFKQLPLNQEIIKKARERKKMFYHKDFVIDEDSQWLLQGWKGRIIYALSTWRPARSS